MNIHSHDPPGRRIIATKNKNNKYNQILEAAIAVFARQGFHHSTISQIAKEAGVADGTIYLYFKNKDDILVQFFSYKTKQVFQRFQRQVNRADTAIDKLANLLKVHLAEFQKDPDMAVVYQTEVHHFNRPAEEKIREMSKMYLDIITGIVEQGQEEGTIRKDLYLSLVKRFIIGAIDEVISTWLHSETSYDLTTMAKPLCELFLKGIGNPDGLKEI